MVLSGCGGSAADSSGAAGPDIFPYANDRGTDVVRPDQVADTAAERVFLEPTHDRLIRTTPGGDPRGIASADIPTDICADPLGQRRRAGGWR